MLKVLVEGGLGSQMCKYAVAKSASLKLGIPFCIDTSIYHTYPQKSWVYTRPYDLKKVFTLSDVPEVYHDDFFWKCGHWYLVRRRGRWDAEILSKIIGLYNADRYPTPEWDRFKRNGIITGMPVGDAYFYEYISEIQKDFTFKNPLDDRNMRIADQMNLCESVSLHVRRGDYLQARYKDNYVHLTSDWYMSAISKINENVTNPHFFIFSEDMQYCHEVFGTLKNTTFIDWNTGGDSYKDMQLMSRCKHNIVANSTFSRWGAWLNKNPNRMVICSAHFYQNKDKDERAMRKKTDGWIYQ